MAQERRLGHRKAESIKPAKEIKLEIVAIDDKAARSVITKDADMSDEDVTILEQDQSGEEAEGEMWKLKLRMYKSNHFKLMQMQK